MGRPDRIPQVTRLNTELVPYDEHLGLDLLLAKILRHSLEYDNLFEQCFNKSIFLSTKKVLGD